MCSKVGNSVYMGKHVYKLVGLPRNLLIALGTFNHGKFQHLATSIATTWKETHLC